jgi:hypothetical protein
VTAQPYESATDLETIDEDEGGTEQPGEPREVRADGINSVAGELGDVDRAADPDVIVVASDVVTGDLVAGDVADGDVADGDVADGDVADGAGIDADSGEDAEADATYPRLATTDQNLAGPDPADPDPASPANLGGYDRADDETGRVVAATGEHTPIAAGLGQQWHDIQALFVDDPLGSVQQAAAEADTAVSALAATLRERQATFSSSGNANDTEQLRESLRSYRIFCQSLTEIGNQLPQPQVVNR